MNRTDRRAAERFRIKSRKRNADASPPMLVMRGLKNDETEVRERMAVEAFALGYATAEHFDILCAMQGVLILAGSTSDKRAPAMHYARNVLGKVMESIRVRHAETGKLDCTAEELQVLRGFVSMYRDFWLRAPVSLYEAACAELQRFHERIAAEREQEAGNAVFRDQNTSI